MTRTNVTLQYPTSDTTDTIQTLTPTETTVVQADGVKISDAFACKDNTLTIAISNTAEEDKTVTIKKGDYPNAVLGDITFTVKTSTTVFVKIENPSRVEQSDGSILVDFATGFTGTIYATGKHAGLKA